MSTPAAQIELDYFDGRSARAHRVTAHVSGATLYLRGSGVVRSVPVAEVQWPQRTQRGARVAHLADGASLHAADAAAFDAWARASELPESVVTRAEQSWRWVGGAVAVLAALCVAMYLWGLPLVTRGVLSFVPHSVDTALGEAALESFRTDMLAPSTLPPAEQARLRAAFEAALKRAYPQGNIPPHQVYFHKSKIGPNAFALPGGTIVMTDELVKLVNGDADVITGVLAHELGHVEHRHGMRMLVQTTLLGVAASVAFGDFSSVLAVAPVVLGQAAYSRDAEREADQAAIRILKDAGIPPRVMVTFFERLSTLDEDRERSTLGIALASHPADAERIRVFEEASR